MHFFNLGEIIKWWYAQEMGMAKEEVGVTKEKVCEAKEIVVVAQKVNNSQTQTVRPNVSKKRLPCTWQSSPGLQISLPSLKRELIL